MLEKVLISLLKLINIIKMEQTETSLQIYTTAKKLIGVSLVPVGDDPDVGCAISVTVLLKEKCNIPIGETQSTHDLLIELIESPLFKEVNEPLPGDIIISATGTSQLAGTPIKHGHTGIVAKFGILSNSSLTGLWSENFTLETWTNRYKYQGGYPTRYFRAL